MFPVFQIVPDFVSIASIRKKEYLKLNRNVDMNKVIDMLDCKITELRAWILCVELFTVFYFKLLKNWISFY